MTVRPFEKLWFGKKKVEEIFLHDQKFYDQNKVTVESGITVTSLDPKQRSVATDGGKQYRYQKLLLATGGVPRTLPIPGGISTASAISGRLTTT